MKSILRSVLGAVFLLIVTCSQAQYAFKEYMVPKKIASRYNFPPETYRSLVNYAGLTTEDFNAFSKTCAYNKYNLFVSGSVYLEWNDVENYLNVVLNRILPDSLKNKLHVYPYRSTVSNAFTLADGSIFVNIGLISEMDDEAQLAVILGHEAAHFIHHDHHFTYKKKLETVRTSDDDEKELREFESAHDDREQEKAADFLGFDLARNAGYNISSAISLFQTLNYTDIIENRKKKKSRLTALNPDEEDEAELLQSHPELKDRIDYLTEYSKKSEMQNAKQFIELNETGFGRLLDVAKHQNLIILLENNLHRRCIEFAFVYHLNDPKDKQSLYFLTEALRRLMYTDVKKEDAAFLTDDDHSGTFKAGESIFHDLTKLFVDSSKYMQVKNKIGDEYKHPPETYKQAFDYFIQKAMFQKVVESYLTMALATEDTSILKSTVQQYLNFPEAKYKEYATALQANSMEYIIRTNKKEVILCSSIDFVTLNKNEAVVQYEKSDKESQKFFEELMQSVKQNSSKQVMSVNSMIEADFEMAQKIYNCTSGMLYAYHKREGTIKTESYYNIKKQKDINFFRIDPEYWMFFKENNLRSIEFYDAVSIISKKKEVYRVSYYAYNTMNINPTSWRRISEYGKLGPKVYSSTFQRCSKQMP